MRKIASLYISTLSIASFCALIIYFQSSLASCAGLAHILRDLLLYLILLLSLIVFVGRQFLRSLKDSDNREVRIASIGLVLIGAIFAFQSPTTWREYRLGEPILKASLYADQLDIGSIELFSDDRCYITYGHIDWTCSFSSIYETHGDTLRLEGNLAEVTQCILVNRYLIADSTLVPLQLDSVHHVRPEVLSIGLRKLN